MIQPYLSYEQVYRLFGYQKEIEMEQVFYELFYSISSISNDASNPFGLVMQQDSNFSLADAPLIFIQEFQEAKKNLPNYLGKKSDPQTMFEIDVRLRFIRMIENKLRQIPFWDLARKIKIKRRMVRQKKEQLPVQTVFQYLEYRAAQDGVDVKKLHTAFKEFAEKFPNRALA